MVNVVPRITVNHQLKPDIFGRYLSETESEKNVAKYSMPPKKKKHMIL